MAYTTKIKDRWVIDSADSLEDVLTFADQPRAWTGLSQDASWSRQAATKTFGEAVNLARMGWAEGRAKLSANLDAANFVQTNSTHRAEALDVGGAYPDVQEYIAGNPAHMVTIGAEQSRTRPIYRFIVSMFSSGSLTPETLMRRGAAILSWVDRLENQGARCEVMMVGAGGGSTSFFLSFMAKRADEPLDVDRLAFVLVHPSMFRRIVFACHERHRELSCFGCGHSMPSDWMPEEIKVNHSIYFGRMTSAEEKWRTPANAVAEVERAIKEAIRHGDEAHHTQDAA